MGSVSSDGTLSQTIATTAGQTYTLSFWLQNEAVGHERLTADMEWTNVAFAQQRGAVLLHRVHLHRNRRLAARPALEFSAANGPQSSGISTISPLTANSMPPANPVPTGADHKSPMDVANSNESVTWTGTAPDRLHGDGVGWRH